MRNVPRQRVGKISGKPLKKAPTFTQAQIRVAECEICHNVREVFKREITRTDGIIVRGDLCEQCYKILCKDTPTMYVEYVEEKVVENKEQEEVEESLDAGDSLLI